MNRNRTFRSKLSFGVDELRKLNLNVARSGISMPAPKDFDSYMKDFSVAKDWLNLAAETYQAHANNSSLEPKPEDFVEKPFRLISATTVGAHTWKATDFSNASILRGSMEGLNGKGVYKDHDTRTDNWAGIVKAVKWSEGFTTDDGVYVPAGIDGILAIDSKTNPKLARGIMIGSIYSNSVTVEFDWEMSHEYELERDFVYALGTMGKDGKMVRRIVTKIYNYHETSLVWLGADPFAKAIDKDGNLQNIDTGSISYEKAADAVKSKYDNDNNYSVTWGLDPGTLRLSKLAPATTTSLNNDKEDMEPLLEAVAKLLSLEANHGLTPDQLIERLEGLEVLDESTKAANTSNQSFVASFSVAAKSVLKEAGEDTETVDPEAFLKDYQFVKTADLEALRTSAASVDTLQAEVDGLKADAEFGKTVITERRAEAIRLYKASVGAGNEDETIIGLFNKADGAEVTALLKQHVGTATEKFSGRCSDCNSTNFEFRSSIATETQKDTPSVRVDRAHLRSKFEGNGAGFLSRKSDN